MKKLLSMIVVLAVTACVTPGQQAKLVAPQPLPNSSGEYVSAYKADGTLAGWTEKSINARIGSEVGKRVGASMFAFLPGMSGPVADAAVKSAAQVGGFGGRELAIQLSGGWEFMRSTTDISFDNKRDLVVYTHVKHGQDANYEDAVTSLQRIYPELDGDKYQSILNDAQAEANRVAAQQASLQ